MTAQATETVLACPECGSTALGVDQTISGTSYCEITRDAGGKVDFGWTGYTEVWWDSSESTDKIECCDCGWDGGEDDLKEAA